MSNEPLPHDLNIAVEIKRMIKAGVSMTVIFDKIKNMKNGPRSWTTFYKHYRSDITDARAVRDEAVGSVIMEKALIDKDMRALELVAKTRMGWNEKVIMEEHDPADVDVETSAVDDLIAALNLKEKTIE